MYNSHFDAVCIENFLISKGYAKLGDASEIQKNPLGYMDSVLRDYEKLSDRHDKRSADFWEKYECFKGKKLDDIDHDTVKQMKTDIRALFDWNESDD